MLDCTDAQYDRVADLNLRATFHFLRAFGRTMSRQKGGSLIASCSVRATTLEPGRVAPDAASCITGTAFLVDGGLSAIDGAPTRLTRTGDAG